MEGVLESGAVVVAGDCALVGLPHGQGVMGLRVVQCLRRLCSRAGLREAEEMRKGLGDGTSLSNRMLLGRSA